MIEAGADALLAVSTAMTETVTRPPVLGLYTMLKPEPTVVSLNTPFTYTTYWMNLCSYRSSVD
jgi:hypothetical protein